MDDLSNIPVISAERIERLRSNLLSKSEVLLTSITTEPDGEEELFANAQTAESIYFLLQSFIELR